MDTDKGECMSVDPFNTKRLNDATPDEWDSAVKNYKYPEVGSEDYFNGSLFDRAEDLFKREEEDEDEVNEPQHYNYGKFETIDVIIDTLGKFEAISYCQGNVLKYTMRMWHKDSPITDCKKARWYLNKMIQLLEETEGLHW